MTGPRTSAQSKDLIVLDLETTGLDPAKHEIIDIAAVRFSCDGRYVSMLTTKLRPEHIDTADPEALAVNGYAPEKWYAANRLVDASDRIRDYLSSPDTIIVGHNVWLDAAFIKAHIPGAAIKYTADTATLAYGLGFDSMSLDHIIKDLGLACRKSGAAAHRDLRCVADEGCVLRASGQNQSVSAGSEEPRYQLPRGG